MKLEDLVEVKQASKILNLSTSTIMELLRDKGVISESLAIIDGKGMVAEISVNDGNFTETHLVLTVKGIRMLLEEVYHEW